MLSPRLLVCVLVCVLVGALVSPPAGAADLDFTPQARDLAGVVACAPGAVSPKRFDAKVLAAHCRQLAMLQRWWHRSWLERAQPFLEKVVPADLPTRVVYPFGGGDLLTRARDLPARDRDQHAVAGAVGRRARRRHHRRRRISTARSPMCAT